MCRNNVMVAAGHGNLDSCPDRPTKFGLWHRQVGDLISNHGPHYLVYERPFSRGLGATRFLWGLAAIVEHNAYLAGVPVVDQVPTSVKKWATGSGKAGKEDMRRAAADRLKNGDAWFDLNEHTADAMLLAWYAWSKIEVEP